MLNYLTDIVSLETKLEQLDFVSDAKEEAGLVKKERENSMVQSELYRDTARLEVENEGESEQ